MFCCHCIGNTISLLSGTNHWWPTNMICFYLVIFINRYYWSPFMSNCGFTNNYCWSHPDFPELVNARQTYRRNSGLNLLLSKDFHTDTHTEYICYSKSLVGSDSSLAGIYFYLVLRTPPLGVVCLSTFPLDLFIRCCNRQVFWLRISATNTFNCHFCPFVGGIFLRASRLWARILQILLHLWWTADVLQPLHTGSSETMFLLCLSVGLRVTSLLSPGTDLSTLALTSFYWWLSGGPTLRQEMSSHLRPWSWSSTCW